ncbi:MAG: response regulator, partial [Planctomycetes bacterium]|nr:response regulator [Planctomycetota bacterium]
MVCVQSIAVYGEADFPKGDSPLPVKTDRAVNADVLQGRKSIRQELRPGEFIPAALNRVLLVDDDPVTLQLYKKILTASGYKVTACKDGNSAWEVYNDSFFPLVVLDWLMPGMDGLTLCRKIRRSRGGACSMVLVVTGRDQPEHLKEVLEAGADYYVTKPINAKLFEIRMAVALQQAEVKRRRYRAEQRLKRQRDRMKASIKMVAQGKREWESTADSLSELVCLLDNKGRLLRANKVVELWTMKSVGDTIGLSLHELLHSCCNDPSCALKHLWSMAQLSLEKGKARTVEIEDSVLDRYLRIQMRPVTLDHEDDQDGHGKSFAVVVVEDITERKRMEVELARAREQEMEIGSRIQQSLLIDRTPENLEGLKLAALTVPSQRVDGDFYAFFRHNDQCLDLLVGDVMGKGIPAALIGAAVKSHFLGSMSSLLAASPGRALPPPEKVVAQVQ